MTRGARISGATLLLALSLTLLASASAMAETGWRDGGANAPATVEFLDVAAAPNVVVAAGFDAASGGEAAAILRRAGGSWGEDSIELPAGATSSRIRAVDVTSSSAWAVGSYTDAGGEKPLVLRITGGAAAITGAAAATWSAPGALDDGLGRPFSVALNGGVGLIGTRAGAVHAIDDAAGGSVAAAVSPAAEAGPINGLAMYSSSEGWAVTDRAPASGNPPSGSRIYKATIGATPELSSLAPAAVSAASPGEADLLSISAVTAAQAVAVEELDAGGAAPPSFWAPDGAAGAWDRHADDAFTNASDTRDASIVDTGGGSVSAIAGDIGGAGTVWRRSGIAAWKRDDSVSEQPLKAVAVVAEDEIWAVGAGGAVVRFGELPPPEEEEPPPPPPPDTVILSGPVDRTTDRDPTFSFGADQPASFQCSIDGSPYRACSSPQTTAPLELGQHVFRVRATNANGVDPSPASRGFVVEEELPPPPPPEGDDPNDNDGSAGSSCKKKKKLSEVKRVELRKKRRGGRRVRRLVIKLKVKVKRAKVRVVAKRRGKVVGRKKAKVLKRGRHTVRLKVRKKPKKVRIRVKDARKCARKRR